MSLKKLGIGPGNKANVNVHVHVPLSDWCPNLSFLCPSLLPWLRPPFDPHWIRIESNAGESTPIEARAGCWWAWLGPEFVEGGPDSGVVRVWVRLRAAGCITGRHILEEGTNKQCTI